MKKSAYLTGAALIQAISLPAYAQGTGSESPAASDADVIIVTARRQEERLQDVPISITVLDQEAVAKRNIYKYKARASVDGELAAEADLMCAIKTL